MTVLRSDNLDAWYNLAVEELLLEAVESLAPALYLWRSRPGVVIGKNQNPWRECRTERMAADGVSLVRRVSGGGAVYHDVGNLNFTLLLRRAAYDEDRQFSLIQRALQALGVQADRVNRNSLAAAGMKVSGNAFCYRRHAALHHGTLLVTADLDRLRRYLAPAPVIYRTHAITSAPAPVTNLANLVPGLDWRTTADALEAVFREEYGNASPALTPDQILTPGFSELLARHRSDAWRLGRTPRFTAEFDLCDHGVDTTLKLDVDKGCITGVALESIPTREIEIVRQALLGCRYDAIQLAERLEPATGEAGVTGAIRACLREQGFCWV